MTLARRALRWLVARLSILIAILAVLDRVARYLAGRARADVARRATERRVLPSLYEAYPEATRAPQRRIGLKTVPIDRIVGTMRHPSQNTADFLPLPRLRGQNWRGRWQRINRALDNLAVLPPVDLMQVGEDYYVADGHNRVAAARHADAVDIDADVTQLVLPGVTTAGRGKLYAGSLIGAAEVRQAGRGRHSRTVEQRTPEDQVMRRDLLRGPETDR